MHLADVSPDVLPADSPTTYVWNPTVVAAALPEAPIPYQQPAGPPTASGYGAPVQPAGSKWPVLAGLALVFWFLGR